MHAPAYRNLFEFDSFFFFFSKCRFNRIMISLKIQYPNSASTRFQLGVIQGRKTESLCHKTNKIHTQTDEISILCRTNIKQSSCRRVSWSSEAFFVVHCCSVPFTIAILLLWLGRILHSVSLDFNVLHTFRWPSQALLMTFNVPKVEYFVHTFSNFVGFFLGV